MERDTSLLLLGFLAQCLQRKSTGWGGKVGRAQVAYRYRKLQEGDWGALVDLFMKDKGKKREERR